MVMALCLLIPAANSQITPVLDGYAYELYDDITIDTTNKIIILNTNMSACEQPNMDDPVDTTVYALDNGTQYIGLSRTTYNIASQRVYFSSETSNLYCTDGVYVDTIYEGDFE